MDNAASATIDDGLLRARIDAVCSMAVPMIAMHLLGSLLLAWPIGQIGGAGLAASWIGAGVAVTIGRAGAALGYRFGRWPGVSPRAWALTITAFAGLSGILWGAAAAFIGATGSDHQVMFAVCVVLSGLSLSIANVAFWPQYAAFEVPVMLGAAIGFAIGERPGHWLLSMAAAILGVAMFGTSRRLARQVLQAHRLAATNQALVDSLGERGRELEQACDALERVSRTDPLTGLANRRSRDMRLGDEWTRAMRNGGSLAVVAIDVDRFKKFNDTHGHDEGDRALQAVADMLQAGIRVPIDLAARHGGEEFMLILPGVDLAGAASIAERVRVMVAKCSTDPAYALPEKVTISLGVAAIEPAPGRSVHELTMTADAALYQAKLAGRNRYEIGTITAVADAA